MTGRGGWSKIGMPANGTGFYQLLEPIHLGTQTSLGPDYLAVHYAVISIQKRCHGLGYPKLLPYDGDFGPTTDVAVRWAQGKLGVTVDGQFGPRTARAFYWPVIQDIAGPTQHTVGGICAHESSFDPGAVGFLTPDDHGLVQINAPANPKVSIAQAFDHRIAFKYCTDRINAAMNTYHNLDIAICSYASPLWAQEWAQTGHSPNAAMINYVDFVQNWTPPS